MKKIIILLLILSAGSKLSASAINPDSTKIQVKLSVLDSLKAQLKATPKDSLKAPLYTQIAAEYLKFDTLSNKRQRINYQNEALNYTMLALHHYSYYNDTLGLRTSFDDLAKVYIAQRKFSQAKWFILQSNTLSRIKKDTLNIISSLVTLASIKSNIKDYSLAMKDLNEALTLAEKKHDLRNQSLVLKNFGFLYSRLKNYPKEEAVLKKRDSIEVLIFKKQTALMVAKVAVQDSVQRKRQDSVISKKKMYTSNYKKLYKGSLNKKVIL